MNGSSEFGPGADLLLLMTRLECVAEDLTDAAEGPKLSRKALRGLADSIEQIVVELRGPLAALGEP